MRYKRNIGAIIIILFSTMFCMAPEASAQQLLGYIEPFDRPAMPGWEFQGAAVENGVLRIQPEGFARRDGLLCDFALSIAGKYSPGGAARISYRQGQGGAYILQLGEDWIALARLDQELAQVSHEIRPGEWVQIEITVVGDLHTIRLGNQPVISIHDPSPLGGTDLQFSATGSNAEFNNLNMENMDPTLPVLPTFNPLGRPAKDPVAQKSTPGTAALIGEPEIYAGIYIFAVLILVGAIVLIRRRRT